jgi:hypothetical protein
MNFKKLKKYKYTNKGLNFLFRSGNSEYNICSSKTKDDVSYAAYKASLFNWFNKVGSTQCQIPCSSTSLRLRTIFKEDPPGNNNCKR